MSSDWRFGVKGYKKHGETLKFFLHAFIFSPQVIKPLSIEDANHLPTSFAHWRLYFDAVGPCAPLTLPLCWSSQGMSWEYSGEPLGLTQTYSLVIVSSRLSILINKLVLSYFVRTPVSPYVVPSVEVLEVRVLYIHLNANNFRAHKHSPHRTQANRIFIN